MVKANDDQERETAYKKGHDQPPAHVRQPEENAQNANTSPPIRPAQATPSPRIDTRITTPSDFHPRKSTTDDDYHDDDASTSSESAVHKNYRTFVAEPNENDIIGGRGAAIQSHPGNTFYRFLIRSKKREYINSRPPIKKQIIRAVVKAIENQSPPGRFLKEDLSYSAGTRYICVTLDEAKKKAGQALREDAPRFKKKSNHFRFSNHRDAQQKGIQDPASPNNDASTSAGMILSGNLRLTQEEAELVIDIRRSNLMRKNPADSKPDVMGTAEMPPLLASALLGQQQQQGEGQTRHDISSRATDTNNGTLFCLGTPTPAEEVPKPNCKIPRNLLQEGMTISNGDRKHFLSNALHNGHNPIPSRQCPQYIHTITNNAAAPTERILYDPLTTAMQLGLQQADIYTPSISWEGRDTVLVQQHYQEPPALVQYHGAHRHDIPSNTPLPPLVIIGGDRSTNTATSSMAQTKSALMGINAEGAPLSLLSPALIGVVPPPENGVITYQTPPTRTFIVSQPAAQHPQQQMDNYDHLLLSSMPTPSRYHHQQPQALMQQHRNYQHGRVTGAGAVGAASSGVYKNSSSSLAARIGML